MYLIFTDRNIDKISILVKQGLLNLQRAFHLAVNSPGPAGWSEKRGKDEKRGLGINVAFCVVGGPDQGTALHEAESHLQPDLFVFPE